jgi:hypothetical protein
MRILTDPVTVRGCVLGPDGKPLPTERHRAPRRVEDRLLAEARGPAMKVLQPGGSHAIVFTGLDFAAAPGWLDCYELADAGRHVIEVTYDPKRVPGWERIPADGAAPLWTRAVAAGRAELWHARLRMTPDESFRTARKFDLIGSRVDPDDPNWIVVDPEEDLTFLYNFGDAPVEGYELTLERVVFDGETFRFYIRNKRPNPFKFPRKVPTRMSLAVDLGRLPRGEYRFEAYVRDRRWRQRDKVQMKWFEQVRSAPKTVLAKNP